MNVCEMKKLSFMMKKMTIMMIHFIPNVADILSVNRKGALSFDNGTTNSASTCLRSEIFVSFDFEHQVTNSSNYHGHRQYNCHCGCYETLTQVEV